MGGHKIMKKFTKKASVPFFTPWIAFIIAAIVGLAYIIYRLIVG